MPQETVDLACFSSLLIGLALLSVFECGEMLRSHNAGELRRHAVEHAGRKHVGIVAKDLCAVLIYNFGLGWIVGYRTVDLLYPPLHLTWQNVRLAVVSSCLVIDFLHPPLQLTRQSV